MALIHKDISLVRILSVHWSANSQSSFQRYHANGWLADVCPIEVAENIVNNLSIVDMMLYGATSSANYKIMHEAICARLVYTLKSFNLCPNDFSRILHTHCAIVSGSFALHVFDHSGGWSPKDLDLYVPIHRVKRVVNRLRAQGYIPIGPPRKGISRVIYGQLIASVTKLTNGKHSIDVVESATRSSISPVFQFHLTAVMNYITFAGFFSAYPTLTTQRRSMINHLHYKDNSPMDALVACYTKYFSRGYDLHSTSKGWADGEGRVHRCQHSFDCPHRICTPYDPGCLFVSWQRTVCCLQTQESFLQRRCFENRQAPLWCLGGSSCAGDREPIHPFVTMKGAESSFEGIANNGHVDEGG